MAQPVSPLAAMLDLPMASNLDVLVEENAQGYWDRSDLFDMAFDLTAGRRGLAALGEVIARWVSHLLAVGVDIEPLVEASNVALTWYVGLDAEATRIGDALWNGAAPWSVLAVEGETTTFYAGAVNINLYRTESGSYRDNLASGRPSLWVALRPTGVEPPYELLAVTADSDEGESFTQSGDDVVAAVPMPPPVHDMIAAFVAEHHVERPFSKRERDRADPEALARGQAARKERDG